jgi:hypothetical protein
MAMSFLLDAPVRRRNYLIKVFIAEPLGLLIGWSLVQLLGCILLRCLAGDGQLDKIEPNHAVNQHDVGDAADRDGIFS